MLLREEATTLPWWLCTSSDAQIRKTKRTNMHGVLTKKKFTVQDDWKLNGKATSFQKMKSFTVKKSLTLQCIDTLTSQWRFHCVVNNEFRNTECFKQQQHKGNPEIPFWTARAYKWDLFPDNQLAESLKWNCCLRHVCLVQEPLTSAT